MPEAVKSARLQEIIATYRAGLTESMAAEVGRTHLVRPWLGRTLRHGAVTRLQARNSIACQRIRSIVESFVQQAPSQRASATHLQHSATGMQVSCRDGLALLGQKSTSRDAV